MIRNNYVRIEFYSRPENEKFARSLAAAYAIEFDPTIDELTELKTGVSEAVSNAIIHGYKGSRDGIVVMEFNADSFGNIYITVSDKGAGIENIEKAREPLFTTGNPDERSGMGFTVMESFMDKVEVESVYGIGTSVMLVKCLGGNIE